MYDELVSLVKSYYHINQTLKAVQQKRDQLNIKIKDKVPTKPIEIGKYIVKRTIVSKSMISKELLKTHGVPDDIIDKCTTKSTFETLVVRHK